MQFVDQRQELPWAVPKKPGYKGEASGLYFHFYATRKEAEKCRRAMKREGRWTDEIQHLPGQAYRLGAFVF